MGSLQADGDSPRRRRVRSARQGQLAAGEDEWRLFLSLAPLFAGRGQRRPMAAVLDRRTPMRSIGYGEGSLHAFGLAESPSHPDFSLRVKSDLSPQAGRGKSTSSALVFERDVELGAVGFDVALCIEVQIELDDIANAKLPKRHSGPFDRCSGRLFP